MGRLKESDDDNEPVPIPTASPRDLENFSKRRILPSESYFRLDVTGTRRSSWNKALTTAFGHCFVGSTWYNGESIELIKAAFSVHLQTLIKNWKAQQRKSDVDIQDDDDLQKDLNSDQRRRSVRVSVRLEFVCCHPNQELTALEAEAQSGSISQRTFTCYQGSQRRWYASSECRRGRWGRFEELHPPVALEIDRSNPVPSGLRQSPRCKQVPGDGAAGTGKMAYSTGSLHQARGREQRGASRSPGELLRRKVVTRYWRKCKKGTPCTAPHGTHVLGEHKRVSLLLPPPRGRNAHSCSQAHSEA